MGLTKSNPKISEPDWATAYRGVNNVPFYLYNIDDKVTNEVRSLSPPENDVSRRLIMGTDSLSLQVRALLEEYSRIPPAEVLKHIYEIVSSLIIERCHVCS